MEKTFVFSDTHFQPLLKDNNGNLISAMTCHDDKALSIAIQIMRDSKPDRIVHIGDLFDGESISEFSKKADRLGEIQAINGKFYPVASWKDTLKMGENFWKYIRKEFPKANLVQFEGNHDIWIDNLFAKKSMAQFSDELHIRNQLFWKELNIDYVNYDYTSEHPTSIRVYGPDDTHCFVLMHGYDNISPVKMRLDFDNVIYGHQHKYLRNSYECNIFGSRLATSIGCLCKKKAGYNSKGAKNSGWQHACCLISQLPDGTYDPHVIEIKRGYVVPNYNGKTYHPIPLGKINPLLKILELPE